MPLSSSCFAISAACGCARNHQKCGLVLEQERQRVHVHRRHDLIEVRGRDGGEADGAVADALHVGDRVAELRVVVDLDLDGALGQDVDLLAEILLGIARRVIERLDAGIFGDDLRLGRRGKRQRGDEQACDDPHGVSSLTFLVVAGRLRGVRPSFNRGGEFLIGHRGAAGATAASGWLLRSARRRRSRSAFISSTKPRR